MEAPPGIEPGMEVLQTSALPLGDGALRGSAYRLTADSRVYNKPAPGFPARTVGVWLLAGNRAVEATRVTVAANIY